MVCVVYLEMCDRGPCSVKVSLVAVGSGAASQSRMQEACKRAGEQARRHAGSSQASILMMRRRCEILLLLEAPGNALGLRMGYGVAAEPSTPAWLGLLRFCLVLPRMETMEMQAPRDGFPEPTRPRAG